MILEFLSEFSNFSQAEQKIFLFCVKKCPFPKARTDDLQFIANSLNLSYKTVWRSLQKISNHKTFGKIVKYIHSDISPKKTIKFEAIFLQGGSFAEMDWESIEANLGEDKAEVSKFLR